MGLHIITFTSSGTWTAPSTVSTIRVEGFGGGGGGGGGGSGLNVNRCPWYWWWGRRWVFIFF